MRKLKRQALGLTKIGMVIGVGSVAEAKLGVGVNVSGQVAGSLSPIGATIGATAVIRMLPKPKRKK